MEKFKQNETPLTHKDPLPQHYLVTADFILNKIKSSEKSENDILNAIFEAIATYSAEYSFNPEQIRYLWNSLKFKIKPSENSSIEDHNKISLARAIYVYERLSDIKPEDTDRKKLDEAIDSYFQEEFSPKIIDESNKILKEAKKHENTLGKHLLPWDFNFVMNKIGYTEKERFSIINYYKEQRKSHGRPSYERLDLNDEDEIKFLQKALSLHEKRPYTVNPISTIGDETNKNSLLTLTDFRRTD
jgi:hypothetical protein